MAEACERTGSRMGVIEVEGLTKDYGAGKGVFDVTFTVNQGEVMGFLGPNGAGKTTTIRQLMGFIRPDKGRAAIGGMDCFRRAAEIQKRLGYLPGEIAFMEDMTGLGFLRFIAEMKGMDRFDRAEELMAFFELDPSGRMKKMSKGMKQKIGIVCAFMQDPEILILDEPTSGLDPLMQNKFIELVLKEKERGKTILMSSHLFEEVERTCDRTAIIREGRIAAVEDMDRLRGGQQKVYKITFGREADAAAFAAGYPGSTREGAYVETRITGPVDGFVKALGAYEVRDLETRIQTLEELFLHFYGEEKEAMR